MAESTAASILRRLGTLKGKRDPHVSHWRDCLLHTFPARASGLNTTFADASQIQQKQAEIMNGTGTDSARILASGLVSGTTPSNSLWFELAVAMATDEEKRWLSESAKTLWENIHASNFDTVTYECKLDLVAAGWCVLYVDKDRENGGFTFEEWPIASCYLGCSKRGGTVDIVYHEYELTAEQAVNDFGNAVSARVQKLAKDKPDEKVEFVHAIYPRTTHVVNAALAKHLPIASCHVEVKTKTLVRESGYHEMPCIVPRWELIPDSVYATGPVSHALPDIKTLNTVGRLELANLDLAVAGMWLAVDDGVLNPRTVKVGPRKVIVANSVESMKELKSGADFNVAFMSEDRLEQRIRKVLLADQLQPQDGPAMTATEVHARIALIRQLLGPIYGRMQSEYLQPLIQRCFGLAFRAGVFSPPPETLADRPYVVKYNSPLARAQKLEEVSAIDQHVAGAVQVAQINPEALDNIDFDAALKYRGEALGVPAIVQRKPKDIAAIRAARAEQQAQVAEQQQMQPVVQEAGKAVAKRVVGAAA